MQHVTVDSAASRGDQKHGGMSLDGVALYLSASSQQMLFNILVEHGKLSGMVDFGCAGFYPEYWEYTKGIYGHFGLETAWPDTLTDAFSGLYKD